MKEQRGGDPVAIYWESVAEVASGAEGPKRNRANELLRLRKLADRYRGLYFPKLPAVTIDVANMSGRSSAAVDPLGGWGQGISIKIKASRVDPFDWEHQILINRIQDHHEVKLSKDKSLLFGHQLRQCPGGEKLRAFEAELLVLQQLLRAEQHRVVEERDRWWDDARGDLQNWGGNGRWFANNASKLWKQWCAERGVPFVPCRHSRAGYEADLKVIFDIEEIDEDRPFTALRPSCSTWPASCLGATRDPKAEGNCPKPITIGDSVMEITPEIWDRWKSEQGRLVGAVYDLIGRDAIQFGVKWPTGEQPVIDEVEGETIVSLPVISKPKPTSTKVTIGFEPEQAAQALEHVLKTAQRDHGFSGLWKSTLAVLANHKDSPGATRVQTELDVAPSNETPTPIDAGQSWELTELDDRMFLALCQTTTVIHCRRSYVGVVDQEDAATVAVKALGLTVPPTEQIVEWGTQRMEALPAPARSEQRGDTRWNLDCMVYPTKAEAQWAYVFTEADQHRNITLESVVQRDGGWAVDDLIKPLDPKPTPIEAGEPEPTPTAQSDLRKRPSKQRNRLSNSETRDLHDRLRVELQTHDGNTRQLAERLAPELGLKVQMLSNHIRKVRELEAA